MDRHLNLIKNDKREVEKRIFPRFPFTYLTFKDQSDKNSQAFEVFNISKSGMQLNLKNGGHTFKPEESLVGTVQWRKSSVKIEGEVKWVKGQNLGIEFKDCEKLKDKLDKFLSIENIVSYMQPVLSRGIELNIPSDLKYWLQADGPFEVFVWEHNDSELKRFQLILLEQFVEWEDGKGLKTGSLLKRKDIDSPLNPEDEFLFEFDTGVDKEKLDVAKSVVENLSTKALPGEVQKFLMQKLGKVLA